MNGDLISRSKLLEKLDELSELFRRRGETEGNGFLAIQCGVTFAIEEVKQAPAEDAEVVRHARWVNESYIGEGEAHFNCSKCGAGETHRLDVPVPYCWKCGAKMDAKEGA